MRRILPMALIAAPTLAALLFAAVLLAPAANAADTAVEAETMTRSTTSNSIIQVIGDANASGSQALAYWQNANATKTVTTTAPTDKVIVRARGTAYSGYPAATLYIDNVSQGAKNVTANTYGDYTWTLASNVAAGSHAIKVAYANDLYGGSSSKDRNLYVDKVTLHGVAAPASACGDGLDNDGDGKVDYPADPGCASALDTDETDLPACSDGLDNDGDGKTDYPADPGCSSATDTNEVDPAACADGLDNDGDGKTDYPNDPGCASALDTDETDLPICSDGLDNDGDGKTDYPTDPGCTSLTDTDEADPPPPAGTVYYSDTFDRDADTFIPPWDDVNEAAADRITTDSSNYLKGGYSAKYTAYDSDVAPLTYSENPRAQLTKNRVFCNGDDKYIGYAIYLPSDFPNLPDTPSWGWVIMDSFGFAPPYSGGTAGVLSLTAYDRLEMLNNNTAFWRTTIQRGQWMTMVVHIKFSTDPTVGYAEIWKDGVKQTLTDGSQKKTYQTFSPNATDCGNLQPTNYRQKGMLDRVTGQPINVVTLWQDEIKVGDTYASVDPAA